MHLSRTEADLVKLAYNIKQQLSDANIGHMSLSFHFEGRTAAGDLKYTVKLGEYEYGETKTSAGSIGAAISEFIRRFGFYKENNCLTLPSVMPKELGEERVTLDLNNTVGIASKVQDEEAGSSDEIPY